jgi:hypothetical protein
MSTVRVHDADVAASRRMGAELDPPAVVRRDRVPRRIAEVTQLVHAAFVRADDRAVGIPTGCEEEIYAPIESLAG